MRGAIAVIVRETAVEAPERDLPWFSKANWASWRDVSGAGALTMVVGIGIEGEGICGEDTGVEFDNRCSSCSSCDWNNWVVLICICCNRPIRAPIVTASSSEEETILAGRGGAKGGGGEGIGANIWFDEGGAGEGETIVKNSVSEKSKEGWFEISSWRVNFQICSISSRPEEDKLSLYISANEFESISG